MSKVFAGVSGFLARLSLLAVVVAVVMVPVAARSRDQIEHRDATRLSIKHNWLGVAPPSKATVAAQQIVAVPAIASLPELPRIARAVSVAVTPVLDSLLLQSSDPVRGPPALRLS